VCISCLKNTDIGFDALITVFLGEQISWGNAEATLNAIIVSGAASRSIWYAVGALTRLGLAGVILFVLLLSFFYHVCLIFTCCLCLIQW
jgi:hypothetical protein